MHLLSTAWNSSPEAYRQQNLQGSRVKPLRTTPSKVGADCKGKMGMGTRTLFQQAKRAVAIERSALAAFVVCQRQRGALALFSQRAVSRMKDDLDTAIHRHVNVPLHRI